MVWRGASAEERWRNTSSRAQPEIGLTGKHKLLEAEMTIKIDFWPTLTFAVVMLSWLTFGVVFLARKKPPAAPESKRERASIFGIALQGTGYGVVWAVHRQPFTPIVSLSRPVEIALAV